MELELNNIVTLKQAKTILNDYNGLKEELVIKGNKKQLLPFIAAQNQERFNIKIHFYEL